MWSSRTCRLSRRVRGQQPDVVPQHPERPHGGGVRLEDAGLEACFRGLAHREVLRSRLLDMPPADKEM